ncbi:MAG: hypothetical protein ACYSWU_13335 [Planctomycetota bacterium]|jgi:hypothetical protein
MNELEKQVRRAHRRLGFRRFLEVLGWCWVATLLVALALIALDMYYPLSINASSWAIEACGGGGWLEHQMAEAARGEATGPLGLGISRWLRLLYAGGLVAAGMGLGLLAAIVWTVATRREPLGTAIEMDRRFGLKERVSSTLSLAPEDRDTKAGRALVKDAVRRLERVDVASRFGVMPGKKVLMPLLPGLLALLVALFPPMAGSPAAAKVKELEAQQQVKKSTETLRNKLTQRRKAAEDKGLKDAERLFKKLEQGTRDMAGGKTERKKALAKLNNLSRELKDRRSQLGTDKIKNELDQLKNIARGPANKFAKAMRDGDFKKAADELKKIQEQLANSELDENEKQQLANQLKQMQDKLNELAEAHQAAQRDLQNQIARMQQAGRSAEASKLQEQLNKLLEQVPQMDQLNDLADQLGQCAECLQDGQLADAADALNQLPANLQQQVDEMEMLNDAMEQLRMARNQMNCAQCGGAGCQACQGPPGMGMGAGSGLGPRPEAEEETATYKSQVRQKPGEGTAVVTGEVDGPNRKGDVKQTIQQDFEAARHSNTDPLTGRRIPRKHQKHVEEYFNRFREGE